MSRLLTIVFVIAAIGVARADEVSVASAPAPPESEAPAVEKVEAPADMSVQAIGPSLGIVTGGRVTPGGARITGHYLYQLAAQDWFDGTASFTFGGGDAACFRDRMDRTLCDHSLADGKSVEIEAGVRRFIGGNDNFWPFARLAVGVGVVRFSDDEVTGLAIPIHLGGGLRVSVADSVALTAAAELELGFGVFNRDLGIEPQLGAIITAGAEFGL